MSTTPTPSQFEFLRSIDTPTEAAAWMWAPDAIFSKPRKAT
jgi:hypothetical protein